MFKKISLAAFAAASFLFVAACGKDDDKVDYTADADCTAIVTADNSYTNSIKAIMDGSCALSGCHSADNPSENVDLSDYAGTKKAFESQDALCTIHHGSGCTPMPDGSPKLSDAVINKIDCWAKNGYVQ